jgi:hypothetical protein
MGQFSHVYLPYFDTTLCKTFLSLMPSPTQRPPLGRPLSAQHKYNF